MSAAKARRPSLAGDGLRRQPSPQLRDEPAVVVVEHDPAWALRAQEELHRIRQELGAVAVRLEHVGSTAVPGLAAKPVLDLQVCVTALEPRARYAEPLQRLGYVFVADPESADYLFFAKPLQRPRSHHLHVCRVGSEQELRHLAVRDFLRADSEEAATYAALKRELAHRHPQDRLAHIAGKEHYLRDLQARAVAWAQRACLRSGPP